MPWGPTSSQGSASHALGPQGQGQDSQEVDFSSREGKTNCLPMGCASRWRVRAAPRGCTQTQNPRRSSHGTLRLWRCVHLGFPISKAAARMFWYPSHSTQAATKLWLACTPPQTPPQASILRGEKRRAPGTSLVVQWLTIHLKMQGMQVRPLIGELISHVPQGN